MENIPGLSTWVVSTERSPFESMAGRKVWMFIAPPCALATCGTAASPNNRATLKKTRFSVFRMFIVTSNLT